MRVFAASHPGELFRLLGSESIDLILLDAHANLFPPRTIVRAMESAGPVDSLPQVVLVGYNGSASYLGRQVRVESVGTGLGVWQELAQTCAMLIGARELGERKQTLRQQRPAWKVFGRVLCIDDDLRFTRLLQIRLADVGVIVDRAATGIEGFDQAVRTRPDAIVTDFIMPEGLGSYLLGRLQDCEIDIPVIFLTEPLGAAQAGFNQQMLELGAKQVLTKPLRIDQLVAELGKIFPIPERPEPRYWLPGFRLDDDHRPTRPNRAQVEPRIRHLYYPTSR